MEDYLGSNGIHLIEEGGKQAPCRELATRAGDRVKAWTWDDGGRAEGWTEGRVRATRGEGGREQGGREAWLLFTTAPPQKGRWRLRRDRSRNKSKSLLCWWSYVESNDLCYFCFSLETKEQTNKIRFHPPSGSILMSLYLCDMVSLSPFASGKGSWCSWHHTACIFKVSGSCWQQPTDPPASQTKHAVWKGLSQCWFSGLYSGKLEMGKKAWKEALIPISEGRCFP